MLIVITIFSLVFLAAAPASYALTLTSPPGPREFTIIVSRHGFNGTVGTFSFTVEQGDLVRITFVYGDTDLQVDNPHAIAFDGYGIETASLGKTNPTVTVQFVADAPGSFKFYCYIPCLGMENLLGIMIVTPSQGSRIATTLSLAVSNTNTNYFLVSVTVNDMNGKALENAPVKFYENTTFGPVFLKSVPTDSRGTAVLNYTATRTGNIKIIAQNPGSTQYANSSKSVYITVVSLPNETQRGIHLGMGQMNRPSSPFYGISYPQNLAMLAVPQTMNIATVAIAGVIVLSVWSTYAYIGRQIIALHRGGKPPIEYGKGQAATSSTIIAPISAPELGQDTYRKLWGLLFLVPVVGVVDALLFNTLGMTLLWKELALVGLAAVETVALVLTVTSQVTDH